jgi:hypothetical protein
MVRWYRGNRGLTVDGLRFLMLRETHNTTGSKEMEHGCHLLMVALSRRTHYTSNGSLSPRRCSKATQGFHPGGELTFHTMGWRGRLSADCEVTARRPRVDRHGRVATRVCVLGSNHLPSNASTLANRRDIGVPAFSVRGIGKPAAHCWVEQMLLVLGEVQGCDCTVWLGK